MNTWSIEAAGFDLQPDTKVITLFIYINLFKNVLIHFRILPGECEFWGIRVMKLSDKLFYEIKVGYCSRANEQLLQWTEN